MNEIIEKLNELEVADVDFDSDEIVYVLVEDNEDNRKRLIELGATEAEITSMIVDGGALDITIFAFEKCGADWYKQDEGFGKKLAFYRKMKDGFAVFAIRKQHLN